MNKIYLDKNIFYIDNFLDNSFYEYISKISYKNSEIEQIQPEIHPQRINVDLNSLEYNFFWDYFLNKINEIFDPLIYEKTGNRHVSVFIPDDKYNNLEYVMGIHKDDFGYKEFLNIKNEDQILLFGGIYYINDNYNGGEICYPSQGIEIKPRANMLVVHSASDEYEHGVKQVYENPRYSIPFFIKKKQT